MTDGIPGGGAGIPGGSPGIPGGGGGRKDMSVVESNNEERSVCCKTWTRCSLIATAIQAAVETSRGI
jgi:hypothetical protein